MSKAKTAKSADADKSGDKSKTKAGAAKPKAAAKAPAKPAAKAKPAEVKKPAKEKTETKAAKAPAKPAKKKGDTEIIVNPKMAEKATSESAPAAAFGNSGLGIKVASKKPALSVAPGVLILGRANQTKIEQTPRPSERRLSKKELQEIKNFLMERRERLLAGMRRELAMQRERAESKAADEVDKATDAYDEDLSFEIATANDQELEEIRIALEKIDKGTYGECEICGCGISHSRLKILPSATTCVSCRGQEEQARRRDEGAPLFNMMGEDAESDGEPT